MYDIKQLTVTFNGETLVFFLFFFATTTIDTKHGCLQP